MTSSSQFPRTSTSTFLTGILWDRWDRVERRPWEGIVYNQKEQDLKLFEIIPSKEVHTYWEVRIYKATRFLEARTRRADTGGSIRKTTNQLTLLRSLWKVSEWRKWTQVATRQSLGSVGCCLTKWILLDSSDEPSGQVTRQVELKATKDWKRRSNTPVITLSFIVRGKWMN